MQKGEKIYAMFQIRNWSFKLKVDSQICFRIPVLTSSAHNYNFLIIISSGIIMFYSFTFSYKKGLQYLQCYCFFLSQDSEDKDIFHIILCYMLSVQAATVMLSFVFNDFLFLLIFFFANYYSFSTHFIF